MEHAGRQRIRFVHVDRPAKPDQKQAREIRSHAARETHARARRLRVIAHLGLPDPRQDPPLAPTIPGSTQQEIAKENKNIADPKSLLPASRKDPFAAFVRSLEPVEHFLLDHCMSYVRVVIPLSSATCTAFKDAIEGAYYGRRMVADWVPFALADVGLLSGMFLAACRDLSLSDHPRKGVFYTMALQYKLSCLRALKSAISADPSAPDDAAVAKVIALVADEIALGNKETSQNHVLGAMKMVDLRGGPQNLGLNGLLDFVLQRLVHDKGIFDQYQCWGDLLLSPAYFARFAAMAGAQATIPKGSLVLITGITGHVASELTKQFLDRGYRVRGTVRDLAKASWLVNDVFKSYVDRGELEVVPIPDIAAEGGFDDAVKGASAVAHVATIGFDADPNKVVTPTVRSTLSILKAALKEPSVKRFVYTGSIVATTMVVPGNTENITKDSWNDAAVEIAWAPPPYNPDRTFPVYMASKVAAEKALWKFVEEEKPPFAVNVVTPQTIIGKRLNKNCTSLSASILPSMYEGNLEITNMLPAMFAVDVKDVALLHLAAALDPDVKSERIQAWGRHQTWNEALALLRKLFPNHKFVDDFVNPPSYSITADLTLPLALLKKWGGQSDWRPIEETYLDNLDHVPRE
ncbi:hypothetical protein QBC34DRAFT_486082 [Podospora aff. communis PSN243]|uniref:NAD-dependent epimerase/dehydratase domain-containing protein n=1 Tax=Podospora aff. communis PSN243 TaxID=3040156 RepID=A0AAV9GHY2_9PEZI|nr:hypothetical protein QBC34DRAFT_486082 [Podospora aff. communis PSN243]